MSTLHYHFILSNSDLTTGAPVSEAGKPGFQHYTPILDLEYLLYGRTLSEMPVEVNTALHTGAYSPIVAVRRLLLELQRQGHPVKIYVYNFGTGLAPYHGDYPADFEVEYTAPALAPRHFYPLCDDPAVKLFSPTLAQRSIERMIGLLSQRDANNIHLVAECVPGGTLSANVLLNLLLGQKIETASSSNDREILQRRRNIVNDLTEQARDLVGEYTIAPFETWGPRTRQEVLNAYADYFQIATIHLLQAVAHWARVPQNAPPVIFGGGCQMLAPLAWVYASQGQAGRALLRQHTLAVTTPWVAYSAQVANSELFDPAVCHYPNMTHVDVNFNNAADPGWRKYEEGFAKEGCGLGAVLFVANRLLDASSSELVAILDRAEQREPIST